MAGTKRTRKATKRSAASDKPRERARAAESMVALLERAVYRAKMEAAQWSAIVARQLDGQAFAALEHELAKARNLMYPVTDEERAIAEIPW